MKITFNNNINNISFNARNKKIRKADDILRLAKNEFPMVSSTYIDTFYKEGTPQKNDLSNNVSKKISNKIEALRDIYLSKTPRAYMTELNNDDMDVVNGVLLRAVSKNKAGNCYEHAVIALAALCANGYTDSKKVHLYLTTECYDKHSEEKVFRNMIDLDHVFVVSSMGKKSNKEKDLVVVDNWLGFTDSVSGASAKFKQILSDDYNYAKRKNERLFLSEMARKRKSTNLDDYLIRNYFSFVCLDSLTEPELEHLGKYTRDNFDCVKPDSKKPQNIPANI